MFQKNIRKMLGLLTAIVIYYVVHEGAHVAAALLLGKQVYGIRIVAWGLGVQVLADTASGSDMQLVMINIAGVVATLIAGYIMVWSRNRILRSPSKTLRSIAYYTTLVLLCLDPLYLSVLYRFVGGGDMNGILRSGIPELAAVIFFLILLGFNLFVFARVIYPSYKRRFLES